MNPEKMKSLSQAENDVRLKQKMRYDSLNATATFLHISELQTCLT